VQNDLSSTGDLFSFDMDISLPREKIIDTVGLKFQNYLLRNTFKRGYQFNKGKVVPVGVSQVPNILTVGMTGSSSELGFSFFPMRKHGTTVDSLEINCIGLPSIRKATFSIAKDIVIDQFPSIEDTTSTMTEAQMDSILASLDFVTWTVGPNVYTDDISLIGVADSISSYTNRSGSYGWILHEQIKNKYTQLLASTKTTLQQNDSLLARAYLEKILRDVDIDSSGAITSEAYALLRYNTEYLLSKLPIVTEPTNDLTAKVSAEITSVNGMLQYTYTITNQAGSNQAVANIYVEDKTTSTTTAPLNWQTEKIAATLDRFYTTTSTNQITAGTTKSGYTVISNSLPIIGKMYIQSERYAVDTTDIKTNSYGAVTITPVAKASQLNANVFIDTLISYNNRAYSLGWMQYYWVRDNNYYQLNNAKTMINMNVPSSAVVILTAFESWLDTIKNLAYINDEGYGLLKYNSIFLREKLSGQ
jgi:hypothetical protein